MNMKKILTVTLMVSAVISARAVAEDHCEYDGDEQCEECEQAECHAVREWQQEVEAAMHFTKKRMPLTYKMLCELKQEEPEEFEEYIEEIFDGIEHFRCIAEVDPAAAQALLRAHEMELETQHLAEEIHATHDDAKVETLRTKLRAKLSKAFELHLKEPLFELKMLEKEVAEIRTMLEKRRANKESIIQRRLDELIGEHDDLGWW